MKSSLLLLIGILSILNSSYCQEKQIQEKNKKAEIYTGISLREGVHLGFLAGDRTSFGGYIGYIGFPTTGLNLRSSFRRKKDSTEDWLWFVRFAAGGGFRKVYEQYWDTSGHIDFVYPNISLTIGRNLYVNYNWGISLETGIYTDFGARSYIIPLWPAIGVKVFREIIRGD